MLQRNKEVGRTDYTDSGKLIAVSAKRKCRVCAHPDWCGYSPNEVISICMRESAGSIKGSKNGGWVHLHREYLVETGNQKPRPKKRPQAPATDLAPLEIRDAVYSQLIRLSPATRYPSELLQGGNGLLSRGFKPDDASLFGSLPADPAGRDALARELRLFVRGRFPDYSVKTAQAGVVGVPGFWQDKVGAVHLWLAAAEAGPMLVIPYRDLDGRIHACQVRRSGVISEGLKRYSWLATPKYSRGVSSGSPIHFTFRRGECPPDAPIIVTEGALKGEAFVRLRKDAKLVATSGVNCSHDELIAATRGHRVCIAFDADHRTNKAVCRQIARLVAGIHQDASARGAQASTSIVVWETAEGRKDKGIDDAALLRINLSAITIPAWYDSLNPVSREEVDAAWEDYSDKSHLKHAA